MEIYVTCRSTKRKDLLQYSSRFYSNQLNLQNSRFILEIQTVSSLRKQKNCNGVVFLTGEKSIGMLLDSRLSIFNMLLTLAHEMVHVKQIAKGQYTGKIARNGRYLTQWRGKPVRAEYMDRPWEIEAFAREFELLKVFVDEGLDQYVSKLNKQY